MLSDNTPEGRYSVVTCDRALRQAGDILIVVWLWSCGVDRLYSTVLHLIFKHHCTTMVVS